MKKCVYCNTVLGENDLTCPECDEETGAGLGGVVRANALLAEGEFDRAAKLFSRLNREAPENIPNAVSHLEARSCGFKLKEGGEIGDAVARLRFAMLRNSRPVEDILRDRELIPEACFTFLEDFEKLADQHEKASADAAELINKYGL